MGKPTGVELVLYLLALTVSAWLFGRRMGRVLAVIRGSKPDADFQLAPLGPRVKEFVWEVLLQAKVIRERRWAGLAHALVFWGFCAFALVTLNHLAAGVGWPLFRLHEGWFGRAYGALAFLFCIAVAVAIVGLAIRRFWVRPRWLGEKVSWESGLIALLIFILMATYGAEYAMQPEEGSTAGKLLWWAHTLALLVFLPLLPLTKHLHLILSPVTVFLSRGGFARIPPLNGEEDFGLDKGTDVTQLLALQAFSCVECGRCQEHCPASNTGKLLNPKEIALGLRGYLRANGAASEEPLLGVHLQEEAVFQCTTCGACEYQCPVGIEHVPLIVGLRRGAVNTGRWEDDYGGELFLKLEKNGNPLGMAQLERDRFVQKQGLPLYDGTQQYLLWLGCMGSYDTRGREIVVALAQVLRAAGITFGVLKKEKCTGDAALRLGNDLAFQQLAEFNISELKKVGATKLISICPHCVRTIGEDWRRLLGADFAIEHHSQVLARLGPKSPRQGGQEARVVYHDPCYLGRYQGVYEEPRQVAARAGTMVETPRSRERSFCCGAGGGLMFLGEEKGRRVNEERARQLVATGADTVAAACPFCQTMFQDALKTVGGVQPPRLLDIAEIAVRGLDN